MLGDGNFRFSILDIGLGKRKAARRRDTRRHGRTQNRKSKIQHPKRRGVLLLVVLSMLVLFLMIGTAFIITSKQAEKAAKYVTATAISDTNAAARGDLLNDVMLQMLRDTDNPNSVLRYHSLLGDMYGNEGFMVIAPGIQNVQWAKPLDPSRYPDADPMTGIPAGSAAGMFGGVTGGQLVQFDVLAPTLQDLYGLPYQVQPDPSTGAPVPTLSSIDGAYNGQVVTFISPGQGASAKGVSTRIVDYRVKAAGVYQFTVMAFQLADGSTVGDTAGGGPHRLIGSRILVNGRAFSGTGVGFNPVLTSPSPVQPRLTVLENVPGVTPESELALLPNAAFFDHSQIYGSSGASGTLPSNPELLLTPSQQLYLQSINADPMDPVRRQEALRLAALVGPPGYGGQDEAYDAADFQNYFLALMQDRPGDRIVLPGPTLRDMVLPSFHRPELINYWRTRMLGAGLQLELNPIMLRKIMSRPSWFDHPSFTGSNAGLAQFHEAFRVALENAGGNLSDALVQKTSQRLLDQTMDTTQSNQVILGPWDVDNDGDGNRDSIWIDFGAPVIMGPNGKLVKPLAAVLCLDLDSRVNLNTAGSMDLADINNITDSLNEWPLADGEESDDTPRGMGWGPAEISLEASIGDMSFRRLLAGNFDAIGRFTPGRFGRDYIDAVAPLNVPGRRGFDFQGQANDFGWPQWGNQLHTAFGSPPDLRVRYGNGLTEYGQPLFEAHLPSERKAVAVGHLTADSPYEATVYAEGTDSDNGYQSADAPFSLAELERLLRVYDTDSTTLPPRLAILAGGSDPAERNRITVESWQVPTATVRLPMDLLPLVDPSAAGRPQTTAELLEIRIRWALNRTDATSYPLYPAPLVGDPNDPTTPAGNVRRLVRQLLAPEYAAGLRLNVNRPLGNGRDDDNNGVVDEPGEQLRAAQYVWKRPPSPSPYITSFDNTNAEALDVNFETAAFAPLKVDFEGRDAPAVVDLYTIQYDAAMQRQLMARDLYVTALMTSAPANYGANEAADRRLAERIAQWAVNAVDFRDADGTMTGFEYDVYPFDGWHVNGLINDKLPGDDGVSGTADDVAVEPDLLPNFRGVVFGVERPELVISETFAMHDRNTMDESDADSPDDLDTDVENGDADFDQKFRPRGAFFLELYNPWPANPSTSADIHAIAEVGTEKDPVDLGVDLAKVDPTGSSPVWRVTVAPITDLNDIAKDPDDPVARNRPTNPERAIYFAGFDPDDRLAVNPAWVDEDGNNRNQDVVAFYNDVATDSRLGVAPVRPGRYMVEGSGKRIMRGDQPT
jgi:hypothetical protein